MALLLSVMDCDYSSALKAAQEKEEEKEGKRSLPLAHSIQVIVHRGRI